MKKFFRIITLVLAFTTLLISANVASAKEIDSTNDLSKILTNESFLELSSDEKMIDSYRKEIHKRMNMMSIMGYSFVTYEEQKLLEDNGYDVIIEENMALKYNKRHGTIQRFYFPVLYKTQNGIEMWYVDYDGEVRVEGIVGKLSSGYVWQKRGNVHYNSNDDDVLVSCTYYAITYDNSTGCISVWEMGNNLRKHYVPTNSIYAGKSGNEGFIFRNESDVYAVRDYGCYTHEFGVRVIAHNVEFVISTDYEADDPDTYSQPLFLMKDGTVKCYCTFYSDELSRPDDDENLIDVRFENGFNL